MVKNLSTCQRGDAGLIPRSGRSSGEGNGNPLHYSCLENFLDRGTWGLPFIGLKRVKHNLAANSVVTLNNITKLS